MAAPRRRPGCSVREPGQDSGKRHVCKRDTKNALNCVHTDNIYTLYLIKIPHVKRHLEDATLESRGQGVCSL